MFRKSQTATEYLILLAVVVVIALIVISVLGGIPGIGGGSKSAASEARLKSLGIGVESYAFSNESGVMILKNNKADSVRVSAVYVDSKECGYGTFVLRAGQSKKINCSNITNTGSDYEYAISVNWTDVTSGAKYVDAPDVKIAGDVVTGLNTNVGSVGSSGGESGGGEEVIEAFSWVDFVAPTLDSGDDSSDYIYVNASINQSDLTEIVWEWDGTNYTLLNDSLIFMYNFEKRSGLGENNTFVMDLYGNRNATVYGEGDEIVLGGDNWVGNGAFDPDGNNDYLLVENVTIDGAMTIAFWYKGSQGGDQFFIDFDGSEASWTDGVVVSNYGANFRLLGGQTIELDAQGDVRDGDWHHIVISQSATTSANVKYYLDGVLLSDQSNKAAVSTLNKDIYIGCNYDKSLESSGVFDNIRMYSRQLSDAEVLLLYNGADLERYDNSTWNVLYNKTKVSHLVNHSYQVYVTNSSSVLNSSGLGYVRRYEYTEPTIGYVSPTPAAGGVSGSYIELNISVDEADLNEVMIDWDGTNITAYGDDLEIYVNFENNAALGESSTYVKNLASYDGLNVYGEGDEIKSDSGAKIGSGYFSADNNNDYLLFENFSIDGAFTLAYWYKSTDSGDEMFFDFDKSTGWRNAFTVTNYGATVQFWDSNSVNHAFDSQGNLRDGNWHHVAVSQSGVSSATLKYYRDGVLITTQTNQKGWETTPQDSIYVGIGSDLAVDSAGSYDDIRIYRRQLSDAEVADLYKNISTIKHDSNTWSFYFNQSAVSAPNSYDVKVHVEDKYTTRFSTSARTYTFS